MIAKKVIRLWRRGHKHYAIYQLVVIFSSKRARGPFFENLGFFNPHSSERQLRIKSKRLAY
jgi:ribosomal protein S16